MGQWTALKGSSATSQAPVEEHGERARGTVTAEERSSSERDRAAAAAAAAVEAAAAEAAAEAAALR